LIKQVLIWVLRIGEITPHHRIGVNCLVKGYTLVDGVHYLKSNLVSLYRFVLNLNTRYVL